MKGHAETGLLGRTKRLFREARRRRVLQVGGAYLALFFVLAEAASIFLPALRLPDWTLTLVVALGILAFPVVVTLAWVFDLDRGSLVRTPPYRVSSGRHLPSAYGASGSRLDPHLWRRAQAIFGDALEQPPEARSSFVADAAGDDPSLRAEVGSLLRAHESGGALDRLASELMDPLVGPLRTPPDVPNAPIDPLPKAGRYQVLEPLGNGGMGIVYRGLDTRLQREVALKFLPPHLSSGAAARRRFLVEARSAAALDHPNICTVHEIGETEDGGLFIAMPLYDGETLDRRLARGPLQWEEAVEVAVQVATGLARAHEADIVHRDIKPANLCLTDQDVVKILDFGIAKVASATATGANAILGTAAYMSPEQARGEAIDARSDLWSLGVVLYEMLTGERLFRGEDRDAVLGAIRSSEPVSLARLGAAAPPPVVSVVAQLLARTPEGRPPSADAVATLLRQSVHTAYDREEDAAEVAPDLAPEGERRQATVVDVVVLAYQELLERLDPAALEARLERFGRSVDAVIHRHGGTTNHFAGDRIVAIFGVPVTHEDDAMRAARAAVELHELAAAAEVPGEEPLAIGIGVATGVLVARPADGADRVYRLAGDPPRTAAGLASRAKAGETLLDDASRRATQGRAEPFRLTVYTGRERELDTLLSSYERSLLGDGRVVSVEGEAGAGKSRLLHEFGDRIAGGKARVVHGHCESYAGSTPYLPFLEVVLEILDIDADQAARGQEAAVLAALREIDPHLEEFAPFYLHLVSVPTKRFPVPRQLKGEQFRVAMREAITALITLASQRTPLVLLLEDWHWADEASIEVLKQLDEVIASYSTLVVVAYRSEHDVEWGSGHPRTMIHLSPLDLAHSTRMIGSILDVAEVSSDVGATLHERAGGNPFFLEELCHSLREAGMLRQDERGVSLSGGPASLHLPTTIQGVIRTRLDRLPSATREVVRSAAVLGREFSLPQLERLGHDRYALERALETLKTVGIVQQTRVVPERTFRFRHVLTQEVAYDTLLQHRRKMLHGRAGRAIQALAGDRSDEHAGRLAYHFSRAEEWREAIRFGRASAGRARSLNEYQEALATLEDVQHWISRLPDDAERRGLEIGTLLQQEELCETLGLRGRQQEILDRLASLVDARADPARLIEVSRRQGDVYTLLGRFDEAREALERALALARDAGDPTAQAHVLRSLGLMGWHQGRPDQALDHIEEALRLDREREDDEAMIADLTNKAQILKDQERYGDALDCLEQALRLLDATPNDLKRSYVLHHMATLYRILGDTERALEHLMTAVETSDRRHLPVQWSFHLTSIAHLQLAEGRVDESVGTYREAVAVARRARYAEGLAQSLRPLGELLAGIGRPGEALPYLREAAELFGQLGNPEREAEVWRNTAEAAEAAGEFDAALDAWGRCRSLVERVDDPEHQLDALDGAARAHRRLGAVDAARSTMTESLELARRSGLRHREAATLNSLGILEWEQGSFAEATVRYEAALEIYRRLGDEVHTGLILNSLGATLRDAGRLVEARARLEEALATNRRTRQRLLEAHTLAALGDVCLESGEVDAALEHFEASRALRRELRDRKGEGWMARSCARAHARVGRTELARRDYATARAIAVEVKDSKLLEACDTAPV